VSSWTRGAVELLERLKPLGLAAPANREILARESFGTELQSVCSTVEHDFAGCYPWPAHAICDGGGYDRDRNASIRTRTEPGRAGIDRLYAPYPALHDDAFARPNRERWRN